MAHDRPDHDEHAHEQPERERAHGRDHELAPAHDPQPLARGAGRGKLLFLDTFSGIAGDMLVSALVDLGVPRQVLLDALRVLPMSGYELVFLRRTRGAIAARGLDVRVNGAQPARDYVAIRAMLEAASALPAGARELALRAF